MPQSFDAHDIAQMLAARADRLARELLPRGRLDGRNWRVGSRGSLSIELTGDRIGLWFDHEAGAGGDALDLVAQVLFRGDLAEAIAWSRRWLGIGDGPVPAVQPRQAAAAAADHAADAERRLALASALWLHACPNLAGTPAAAYLAGRGIELADLGRQPRALRYHPALWCQEAGAKLPAMVAAVTDASGQHTATHRTWLASRAGAWTKAPLSSPKKSIGRVRGGSIRIWRGSSGKSLRDAPAGDTVVIAEGIETALSIVLACPELRVLAAVSLGNMTALALPPAIGTVILAADNDTGAPAIAALQRAVDRFAAEGRIVRVARSPVGSDFNDLLQAAE